MRFFRSKTAEGPRFGRLLACLIIYLVISPFLAQKPATNILVHASLTSVIFFSIYAVGKKRKERKWAIALLLLALAIYWLGIFRIIPLSALGAYALFAVYFALLTYSFFKEIIRTQKVDSNLIFAALSLYLIIGLFWGALFALLEEVAPGSFAGKLLDTHGAGVGHYHIFNYFSLVTLTTLGYGDIAPQNLGALALCQTEAIIGQFFLAVFMARMVSLYVSTKTPAKDEPEEETTDSGS